MKPDKKPNILCIIPARGGSKGIVAKNMALIDNKPLVQYALDSVINLKFISKVVVSSDNDEILSYCSNYCETIKRPDDLSTDEAKMEGVVFHVLNELAKKNNELYDIILLLQPTSPLRTESHIENAFFNFFISTATALISVYKPKQHPMKSFLLNEKGFLTGLINDHFPFKNRQELPNCYMPNGAIYIVSTEEFIKNKTFLSDKTMIFEMDEKESIDIDTHEDLVNAERNLKFKRNYN